MHAIQSRPAEGYCFLPSAYSNSFGVFSPGPRDCYCLPSRTRENASASPRSLLTSAATPIAREYAAAPSLAREHACAFCVCFILCDRLPRVPCPPAAMTAATSPLFPVRTGSDCRHLASLPTQMTNCELGLGTSGT